MLGLATAVLATSTIWVEAPDERRDCELPIEIAEAVASLVPDATVRVGDLGADGDLRLRVGEGEDGLHVELALGGDVLLARTLVAPARCDELADTVALIVERFLSDIDWRPAGVAAPTDEAAPDGSGALDDAALAALRPRAGPRLEAELGGRVLFAVAPVQVGVAVEVRLRRRGLELRAELGALAPRADEIDVRGEVGEVRTSSLYGLAGIGLSRGRLWIGALAGAERVSASASGETIFQRDDQAAWQPLLRGDVGVAFPLGHGLALRVGGALEWRPDPLEIMVEGAETPQRSGLGGQLGAGVAWRFR